MIISKTDEVRRELLAMTHEIAEQEEQNFRIAECIWGRLVVPHDQPDLQKAADGIAGILQIPAEKAMPLIVIARRIGIRDERLPGFLRRMERYLTVYHAEELKENPYFSRIRAIRLRFRGRSGSSGTKALISFSLFLSADTAASRLSTDAGAGSFPSESGPMTSRIRALAISVSRLYSFCSSCA